MIWMDIPRAPGYKASLDGRLMSLKGKEPRIMKQTMGDQGYYVVGLCINGKIVTRKVHTWVAAAFLGPLPDDKEICHKDGNKLNNHVGNLRYGTSSDNNHDQVKHGTHHEANRTACDQGHEFTPENTMRRKSRNGNEIRKCKECHRLAIARWRAKKKAKETT